MSSAQVDSRIGVIRFTYEDEWVTLRNLDTRILGLTDLVGLWTGYYFSILEPSEPEPTWHSTRPAMRSSAQEPTLSLARFMLGRRTHVERISLNSPLEIVLYVTYGGASLLALASRWEALKSTIYRRRTENEIEKQRYRALKTKRAQKMINEWVEEELRVRKVNASALGSSLSNAAEAAAEIDDIRSLNDPGSSDGNLESSDT